MTKNASTKRIARARAERHDIPYTRALAETKVLAHPQIDMMDGNGSLAPLVAAHYIPLLESVSDHWILINVGPGWNMLAYFPDVKGYDYGMAVHLITSEHVGAEYPDTDWRSLSARELLGEVWDVPQDEGDLTKMAFAFVGVMVDMYTNVVPEDALPEGAPPFGKLMTIEGSDERGVMIFNDGPEFKDQLIATMKWAASESGGSE